MIEVAKKTSWFVKCDCCGTETMAEVQPDRIIIMDRRHGKKHIAVITRDEIMEKMNLEDSYT